MTKEDLNRLAEEIRSSKNPKQMTKREFVNAFGCEKRTSGNVYYINKWLNDNHLVTDPNYEKGWIDEPMELCFKYNIKHSHFQLYSLWVDNYRNLRNFSIDFEQTDHYCTFVGLNGSGKSNVLEVISEIFHCLYRNKPCKFEYVLRYIMEGELYEIKNGKINGTVVTKEQLPRNVVASYSGEDNRMWKSHYYPVYEEYCQNIAEMPNISIPEMLAVRREQWSIAFLALLYARSSNYTVNDFLKSIINTSECRIRFEFNEANFEVWKETTGKNFVRRLMSKTEYSVEEFASTIEELDYVDSPSTLFNLLYQATAERGTNPISGIDIFIDGHGSLNGLSEGEKKMIVVITIMEILSTERSLCLFDEPDSHVHVSRKMEMLRLIDTENRYSVLTTHSPMFIDEKKEFNVRFMNNGKVENVDKLRLVKQLSGGTISLIDAAYIIGCKKKILLVEGQYDKKYIEKAINILSSAENHYDKLLNEVFIIKCGGTGSAISTYQELIEKHIDELAKIVFLFDYDSSGVGAYKKIIELTKSKKELVDKIVPIFYQENYSDILEIKCPKKGEDDYMVEDVFPRESYADEIKRLCAYSTHREYRRHDDNVQSAIKTYIEKHFDQDNFKDEWFNGFAHILDKLMEVFNLK